MPWFRVDDGFSNNKKVMRIPRNRRVAAVGLWTLLGTWCAHNLTDGAVDNHMVEEIGGTQRQADDLVACELWEKTETGYQFLNWPEYQPTKHDTEASRERARERMRRLRGGSPDVRANTSEQHAKFAGSSGEVRDPRPDPTRPAPEVPTELPKEGTRKRAHTLPPGWRPTDETAAAIKHEVPGIDLTAEHRKFVDHWTGNGKAMKDWEAVWRNWMRRSVQFQAKGAPTTAATRSTPTSDESCSKPGHSGWANNCGQCRADALAGNAPAETGELKQRDMSALFGGLLKQVPA